MRYWSSPVTVRYARLAAKFLDANATSNLQFSAARMQAVILSLGRTRQCHRWTGRYDVHLHVHQRGSRCDNSSYPTPYYSAWYHDNGAARIYVVSEFCRTERLLGAESIRRTGHVQTGARDPYPSSDSLGVGSDWWSGGGEEDGGS
jgi:hypothetical protein